MTTTVIPASPAFTTDPASPRRRPWRSPADQPQHARPLLLGIAALAAVLYFWNIDQSQYHAFYADSVRSMTESWKAFVYGSYDPANTITLDKLPGFLWPQALSARIFGFHPWALTLPQAIEGVLAVLVMYRVVRRWAGANAGLLAALAFTLTPVAAGLFRTAVEDPAFTLLLLLAADAAQRAARTARPRSLLLAGVWVGLAFQTKMLESWAVLPALAAVYLLSAPTTLRRRFGHVALAGLVTVAVSASWILLVTLTPAADRPYVDGTTDNSAYSMVVGYNFLNRFSSVGLSASDTGSVSAVRGGPGGGGAPGGGHTGHTGQTHVRNGAAQAAAPTRAAGGGGGGGGGYGGAGGDGGWSKMFASQFASQTGWLYPLAAIGAVLGLLWRRREPRTDALRGGYVLWGTWLVVFFLVFSAGSVGGHSYYMGVIAAPLAALSGAGTVTLWQAFRAGGRRAWALPVAIVGTVAWCSVLTWRFPTFLPWLAPAAIGLGAVALALLAASRTGRFAGRRLAVAGLLAGLAAMLVAPGAWAASVLDSRYGNSGMGTVGPAAAAAGVARGSWAGMAKGGQGGGGDGSQHLSASQQALFDYLKVRQNGARYLFAVSSWSSASPFILATGAEVLPMGGFTGQVPSPTLHEFQQLVSSGELHYVLLGEGRGFGGFGGAGGFGGGAGGFGGGGPTGTPTAGIMSWVQSTCTVVPPADYAGATPAAPAANGRGGGGTQQLYSCGNAA